MAGKKQSPVDTVVAPVLAATALAAAAGGAIAGRRKDHDEATPGAVAGHGEATWSDEQEAPPGEGPAEEPKKKGLLDKVGDRVPFLRLPIAVQKRFGELQGNQLAAAITLQAFLALFPLLLVAVAVVGFVAAGNGTDVAGKVISQLGLTGSAAKSMREAIATAIESRRTASIVGLAGLLWSGLGLVAALQYGLDQTWQVTDRGLKDKAVGLLWLVGAAVLFIAGAAVTTILRWLPGFLSPVGVLVSFAVSLGLWIWSLKLLPNARVGWREVLPGAVLGAVGLEVLKVVGAYYVPRAVASSSALYGSIGVVFAVLAWLLLFSRLLVYANVLNVVLHERRDGVVRAIVEVPRGAQPDNTPEVTRSGRVDDIDAAAPTSHG